MINVKIRYFFNYIGYGCEEKGENIRLKKTCYCHSSSYSTTTKNDNDISHAIYTLSQLKNECNLLAQDQMGYTPLVSKI